MMAHVGRTLLSAAVEVGFDFVLGFDFDSYF
jgi:hypothetical protein